MAGHIDTTVFIAAPLALTWEIANSPAGDRHSGGEHDIVARDPARGSVVYKIATPPDPAGRSWTYFAERIVDPETRTAFARRWGNPNFLYSHAFWQYGEADGGSAIRCVADFEMAPGAAVDDRGMEEIMTRGTEAAMRRTAEAVQTAHAQRSSGTVD
jgi:aromatase